MRTTPAIDPLGRLGLALAPLLLAANLVAAGAYDFLLIERRPAMTLCIAAAVASLVLALLLITRARPDRTPEQLGFTDRHAARLYSRSFLGIPRLWKYLQILMFFAFFMQSLLGGTAIGMAPVFAGFLLAGAAGAAARRWPIDALEKVPGG